MRHFPKHITTVVVLLLLPLYLISCSGNTETSLSSGNISVDMKVGPPDQPTALTASGADGHVDLSWTPPGGENLATSYNLYWSTTGSVTIASDKILNVSMPFAHRELVNGTTYYYRVSGVNIYGEGPLSEEVQAVPALPFTRILAKLTDPDAEVGDQFGYAVAIDGNYAIVGAMFSEAGLDTNNPIVDAGAAYIFHRSDTGLWDPAGFKLEAPDAASYSNFGRVVSISGAYAIVGAPSQDQIGAAYIFNSTGTNSWDAGIKIVAPSGASARFGSGVSISGDYAVVGDDGTGRVFVFRRTATNAWDSWAELQAPPDTEVADYFGCSVAMSGDYVIVGAYGEDGDAGNTRTEAGAAYIFHRRTINGMDDWTQFSKIMPYDSEAGADFGRAVAISGDYAIVGAYAASGGENYLVPEAGAAYIFHRIEDNFWDEGQKVVAPDAQAWDRFGRSVAITDTYALVGSPREDCGWDESENEGAAYIYKRAGTNSWDRGTKITIPQGDSNDGFGYSVAMDGENAIIGATGDDGSEEEIWNAGAVYLY